MKFIIAKNIMLIAALIFVLILAQPTCASLMVGGIPVCIGEAIRIWIAGRSVTDWEETTSEPYISISDLLCLGDFFIFIGFCVMGLGYSLLMLPMALVIFPLNNMSQEANKDMRGLCLFFKNESQLYDAYTRNLIPKLKPNARQKKWSFAVCWNKNREQYFLLFVITVFIGIALQLNVLVN